jgi:asparagine synthase (glutamine-hydrolysing)
MVFGARRTPAPAGLEPLTGSPREVLEELLVPALTRPPCLVAFSGGRDSSAILAAATSAARARGLDDPVPVTLRFAQHPRTWESDWQETTVKHLGLGAWERIELTDELDAVGAIAGPALRRHGPYWPPNAQTLVPMLRAAAGGSLVTGNGGDETFSTWPDRRVSLIRRGRLRPARADLRLVAMSFLPPGLRALVRRRRHPFTLPWLTPEASREVGILFAQEGTQRYPTWLRGLEILLESRYLELALSIFEALAADHDVAMVQPFLDMRYAKAVVAASPREGYLSRTEAMEAHFGDLLPPEVLGRSTKASFTETLWGPATRGFAESWDGTGLDEALVDVDALRAEWARPKPDMRALSPLQSAWLASRSQA